MAELKLEKRMAEVIWTLTDDQIVTEKCLRGIPWVFRHISDSPHTDTAKSVCVRWVEQAVKTETDKDGHKVPVTDAAGNAVLEQRERILLNCAPTEAVALVPAEGDKPEVPAVPALSLMENVARALTAAQQRVGSPMAALYTLISRLMEAWDIRGAILTVLAGDERVEGFGLLTESSPVTEQNIVLLAESAQNHVDGFKAEMRKKHNIIFMGDKGSIIVPGQ